MGVAAARERLTAIAANDFRALYERTAIPLRAYLRRLSGSIDLADDLMQDTYVRFLGAEVPAGMTEEQTTAYLYRTATRLVYDEWRRRGTIRRHELSTVAGLDASAGPVPVGPAHDVEAVLSRLRPRERALLWLAYGEGRSHREVARILDLRPASVRVLLFRAKRKAARILAAT